MRVLEAGVGIAALLSVGLLAVMLAAPWLPQRTAATLPVPTVQPTPTASAEAGVPPIGLFLLRGPFSFGPCLALELTPQSYPLAEGAEGTATILTWERGMTGCDARSGEIEQIDASVSRVVSEDEDARVVGYAVAFRLPLGDRAESAVEITILANQSTSILVQALETSAQGSPGLVFDRVPSVDPSLNPLPSQPPTAIAPPTGLFLLQGTAEEGGECLVIELGEPSYPVDPNAGGTARVRSWEPAVADPSDPARCLTRRGDIHETQASVVAVRDSSGMALAYLVRIAGSDALQAIEISFDAAQPRPDQLEATFIEPDGGVRVFDRVDAIEPPLAPDP